jgi:uncharacterized protein YjcR
MSRYIQLMEARNLHLAGHPQKEIAQQLGVSENTVTAWKRQEKWGPAPKLGAKAAQQKEAFQLYREGKSQQEIAQRLGVSENTITTWKKQGHWLARLALLQDKRLDEALTQVRKVVLAEVERLHTSQCGYHADALHRALAYVCQQLDRGDLTPEAP